MEVFMKTLTKDNGDGTTGAVIAKVAKYQNMPILEFIKQDES